MHDVNKACIKHYIIVHCNVFIHNIIIIIMEGIM